MTDPRAVPKFSPPVLAAVTWLIGQKNASQSTVLLRAHVAGLLQKNGDGHFWKCNGSLLTRLIRHRVRAGKLPMQGAVFVGIGEMIARAHADEDELGSLLGRFFRHSYPEVIRLQVLRQTLGLLSSEKAVSTSSPSTIYEKVQFSVMDWKQITLADQWMQHPTPLGSHFSNGLRFIVRLLLRNDPARLLWFVNEAHKRGLLAETAAVVGEACFWREDSAYKALKSGVPLFVSFGVARIRHGNEDGEGKLASDIILELAGHNVAPEGRIYLCAFMLKEAVHAWHRHKDRPLDNQRAQAILAIDPHQAPGGERNAVHEIELLKNRAPDLERRLSGVQQALDDALRTAANLNINPHEGWPIFERSLVDTPVIRHRFAMAHSDQPRRLVALKEALAPFDKLVGVRHPKTICNEDFEAVRASWDFAFWAANSQVELSNIQGSNAGRDVGRRIAKVEPVLRGFVLQPFAFARFPTRFQNNIGRWSIVLQFAFLVALHDQICQRERLTNEALKSASAFMPVAERFAHDPRWVDIVSGLASDAVLTIHGQNVRTWVNKERQPPVFRAQLTWGCPKMLDEDLDFATSLLHEVVARKTNPATADRNASSLLDILDRAAVSMLQENRSDLFEHLAIPLEMAVSQSDAPLLKGLTTKLFFSALNADRGARKAFLENPLWAGSRLARQFGEIG
jgi:hypothetical protein